MRKLAAAAVAAVLAAILFAPAGRAQQPGATAPAAPPPAAAPPAASPPTAAPPSATPAAPPAALAPRWKEGDDCVQRNKRDIDIELRRHRHPAGPELRGTTYFLPAGGPVDVVLNEPFKEGTHYFGLIELVHDNNIYSLLGRGRVSASKIPDNHALVTRNLAAKDDTLITINVPSHLGSFWRRANLYIYTCAAPGSPKWVSEAVMRTSAPLYSAAAVWLALIVLYVLAAVASSRMGAQGARWWRYLDPVYLTAGTDGKGSLSKLQILFFSMIVAGLLAYIVARTGVLSDISSTVLMLLGIAGVGSAAAKGTDSRRNRLDPDNSAWLINKNWLPPAGIAAANKASWADIITSDGEFDVYRYQNVIFSLVVGVALIASGVSELATFTIPETLLGILGLSQVVYVGGKLVTPTTIGELNQSITQLRELEKAFIDAAIAGSDPNPAAGGTALAVARRRAGDAAYAAYLEKARTVRVQFELATGRKVNAADIEPAPPP